MILKQPKAFFPQWDCPLYENQFQQFSTYLEELVETNAHMNLTAITEPEEIWAKHFLDSAVLLKQLELPLDASCIDVGTGAGFPGMVLAILRPDLQVTLLDSLQKRVGFLERIAEKLGLANVRCMHARAEDAARDAAYREQFDLATARAVAALPTLTEYCLPFVKVGGQFAAMKGPSESPADAAKAVALLGGEMADTLAYALEKVGERQIILVKKISQTATKYPRKGVRIRSNPL